MKHLEKMGFPMAPKPLGFSYSKNIANFEAINKSFLQAQTSYFWRVYDTYFDRKSLTNCISIEMISSFKEFKVNSWFEKH